ncbi:MAG: hypothetical protein H6631_07045 [Anaerolineaceae bacterium]|nr:hypothetical protein [Anaerolineaceae bacterium]
MTVNKALIVTTQHRRRLAVSLGLFLFAVYLFTYRGGFHSVDEVSMFAVTESLVKLGRLNTDQIAWTQWTTTQAEAQGFFGADGHVYSKKGLALSLAQAPLYWLALTLPGLGMLQTVSMLNALVTAGTALLLFMFVIRLNFTVATALATSLIFGLATIAWVYAKYLFSEPLTGLLLLLAAYMLYAFRQEGGLHHVVIAGLAAGFAVVARANNLFLLPVFGLYLLWVTPRPAINPRHSSSIMYYSSFIIHYSLFSFVAALAVPGLMLLGYNALRSGNPFQTGYDLTLFSSNLGLGLYKLLFSPLRGLFVYSPILLLSLPGWQRLRRTHPAESWLFAGLVGVTIALFSAWSSGEGLSWGSRFLVPIVPFFTLCLAPLIEQITGSAPSPSDDTSASPSPRPTFYVLRVTFYLLLALSFIIQILGVAINPWVFLSHIQTEFGGEFFLENTAALYDFRYSQIAGQLLNWSVENSDLAWWQPWGFDLIAFGLSIGLVGLTGWLLYRAAGLQSSRGAEWQGGKVAGWQGDRVAGLQSDRVAASQSHKATESQSHRVTNAQDISAKEPAERYRPTTKLIPALSLSLSLSLLLPYLLLARYNHTDQQFGLPDDAYTQALNQAATAGAQGQPIVTVAQYHYHVPMNRFKARVPLIGLAQQRWPMPDTAIPLLESATVGDVTHLVTIGFPSASPDNAAEQWLALNTFKISDEWLPDEVRLARFTSVQPTATRRIEATFDQTIQLTAIKLLTSLSPDQPLPVEFTWQPIDQPQADYNLFLQLLNIDGALIAQHDSPPNGGYTPTSGWSGGKTVASRHALLLPPNLPAGDYRLIAGLYDPATGRRLPTAAGSDFVELGNITVQSSNVAFHD